MSRNLEDNYIGEEKDIIGKRIVASSIEDPYTLGYIIFDDGTYYPLEETEYGFRVPTSSSVEYKLINNEELRKLFFENNVIDEEENLRLLKIREEKCKNHELWLEKAEFKRYIELNDKFKNKKELNIDNIFDGQKYLGSHYSSILDKAISNGYYYFSFNDRVYSVENKDTSNPICLISDLK